MDQELGLAIVFYNIILCLGPDRLLGLNISRKPPVVAVITSQSTLNWPDIWTSIKIKHNLDSNWQLTSTVTPFPSYQSTPLPLKLKSAWQQEKWEIPPILWETEADIVTWSLPPSLPPSTQLPLTASSCGVQQGCLQTQKWGRELNCCQKTPAPLSIWTFHVLIIYEADSWYYVLTNWKSFQTWRTVLTLTLIMIMWHCDTFNIKYRLTFWLWPSLDQV